MKNPPFDLIDLKLIVDTVALGGLSAAAREAGVTPAAASRRLAEVEARLGTCLFSRSTYRLQLTPEGKAFLPHARRVLATAADAADTVQSCSRDDPPHTLSGFLRLTAPVFFGHKVVVPILAELLAAHPALRLDLMLTDTMLDLVEARCHAAVRLAPMLLVPRSNAQQIGESRQVLCASPTYLARRGMPADASELAQHDGLLHAGVDGWILRSFSGEARLLQPRARMTANGGEALRQACLAGLGIGLHAIWEVADCLASGELVALPDCLGTPDAAGIWLVLPPTAEAVEVPVHLHVFVTMLTRRLQALQRPLTPADGGGGRAT